MLTERNTDPCLVRKGFNFNVAFLSFLLNCQHQARHWAVSDMTVGHWRLDLDKQQITALSSLSSPSDRSLPPVPLVSGAPAAQRQPLIASDAQQHHPQSGPYRPPSAGRSVEHRADGGLSDGGRRLHGRGGGGGAEPLRPLWRRHGGNRTLPATGAAGGGGRQGEVDVEFHYIKLRLQGFRFELWSAERAFH